MSQENFGGAVSTKRHPLRSIAHPIGVLLGLSKDDEIADLEELRSFYNRKLDFSAPETLTNVEKIDRITELSKGIYERRKSIAGNRIAIAGLAFAATNVAVAFLNFSLANAIRQSGNKEIQVTIKSAPDLSVRVDAPISIRKAVGDLPSQQLPTR